MTNDLRLTTNTFFDDIWRGLSASPKYLQSKYFYDDLGDAIFQEIMACPEYYLTKCELDIFSNKSSELSNTILSYFRDFDVVELGAGDASKSAHFLEALLKHEIDFTYYPIDISKNIIAYLNKKLPLALPGIKVHGLNGEYLDMLEELKGVATRNKVVLFLGSNIGNILIENTVAFFKELRSHLVPGDFVLTGFDLKKDPHIILAAYNDAAGITRRFNLNLLQRINSILDADFDISQFAHRPVYNEQTGACKSYLESLKTQRVRIGEVGWIHFKEGERIFMEISQKYTPQQTDGFAREAGFIPVRHFYDSKKWFLDALWQCM
jgi:L-histidine Nalpha-methyltransferase